MYEMKVKTCFNLYITVEEVGWKSVNQMVISNCPCNCSVFVVLLSKVRFREVLKILAFKSLTANAKQLVYLIFLRTHSSEE